MTSLFPFRLYAERSDQHWLTIAFGVGFEGILIAFGPWCFGVEFGRG